MDSYEGTHYVTLQPGDTNVPVRFRYNPCTASSANDGAIPYGATVHKRRVSVHAARSTAESTHLIVSCSLSSNTVVNYLTWSTRLARGKYHLTARITCALEGSTVMAMVRQFDFNRLFLKDR
jgi:hypothetical protein